MTEKHIHDCTGPDMTCPCGHKFKVPRFAVSFDVHDNETGKSIVGDAFSSDSLFAAIDAFEEAARTLDTPTSARG